MIRPEHQFDIRPDLRKAASTKAESTTAESVIRPKLLVRGKTITREGTKQIVQNTNLLILCKTVFYSNILTNRQDGRERRSQTF